MSSSKKRETNFVDSDRVSKAGKRVSRHEIIIINHKNENSHKTKAEQAINATFRAISPVHDVSSPRDFKDAKLIFC